MSRKYNTKHSRNKKRDGKFPGYQKIKLTK